jgi:hypothetical protein
MFMMYHRIFIMSIITCATSGAGTVYPSETHHSPFGNLAVGIVLSFSRQREEKLYRGNQRP